MSKQGTVAKWNNERGFGFIQPSDGSQEIFAHTTQLDGGNALVVGATVTFDEMMDDRGNSGKMRAINVKGAGVTTMDRSFRQQQGGGFGGGGGYGQPQFGGGFPGAAGGMGGMGGFP